MSGVLISNVTLPSARDVRTLSVAISKRKVSLKNDLICCGIYPQQKRNIAAIYFAAKVKNEVLHPT
jgi:hypothetical protein